MFVYGGFIGFVEGEEGGVSSQISEMKIFGLFIHQLLSSNEIAIDLPNAKKKKEKEKKNPFSYLVNYLLTRLISSWMKSLAKCI